MKYGVGISSFGSGSAAGKTKLLSSRHSFSSDALKIFEPIIAYIDPQKLAVSIKKAY